MSMVIQLASAGGRVLSGARRVPGCACTGGCVPRWGACCASLILMWCWRWPLSPRLLIDPLAGHEVKGVTPLAALLAAVNRACRWWARRRHPLAVLATVGAAAARVPWGVFHPDRAAAAVVMLAVFHRRALWPAGPAPLIVGGRDGAGRGPRGVLVTSLAGGSVGAAVPEAGWRTWP